MTTWHDTADYSREYAETSDPRVVVVIEREQNELTRVIDGDAYAPAYWLNYRGGYSLDRAASSFEDDEKADALAAALNTWGRNSETAERYMRIFHGVEFRSVEVYRGDELILLDTPAHREACAGGDDETRAILARWTTDEWLAGDLDTWRAIRDGEVYGVGYAVNLGRVLDDGEPVDLDDGAWEVTLECWGAVGTEYARSEALEMSYGEPVLPTMLDI